MANIGFVIMVLPRFCRLECAWLEAQGSTENLHVDELVPLPPEELLATLSYCASRPFVPMQKVAAETIHKRRICRLSRRSSAACNRRKDKESSGNITI
jgi:hypothetical protein